MIIVAGHLVVDPEQREAYLRGCVGAVEQARATAGCLNFCLGADLVDSSRINVLERWESVEAVEAFRGSGPDDAQSAAILHASVTEHEVLSSRSLT